MNSLYNQINYSKKRMIPKKRDNSAFGSLSKILPSPKTSQATVFIILAILIVAAIILFFVFRGNLSFGGPPSDLEPVYTFYLNCIEQETQIAANILGQQGGYIEGPDFSPGSEYMPFSNYLNFVGIPIPYWNNIVKEQVPSTDDMEEEMNKFLEYRILQCDFSRFASEGFEIAVGSDISVETKIRENRIDVNVNHNLVIKREEQSWTGNRHSNDVQSSLGKFHELANKIYEDFKETTFLEDYGVDILRLYAPVDGVEIQCGPAIWNVEEVRANLTTALEANIPFTKIKGDYYDLSTPENEYFIHDLGENTDIPVNFLFSRNWPTVMEVWPNDDGILIAEPVGTQEGLGILGFCYVPYHFVYDLGYPVLIQMHNSDGIFQFPVVVYINKNRPRNPIPGSNIEGTPNELCRYKNTEVSVSTFNSNLEPVSAQIKYKCFDESCRIGNTNSQGTLTEKFPQCGNGYVVASAPGYETKKEIFSTIQPGSISLFLEKKYPLEVEIEGIEGQAVVTFTKEDQVKTIGYPDQKQVELTAGQYEIKLYAYTDTAVRLEGSTQQKCVEVPKSGLGGFFGATDEKCFNMNIPSQTIDTGVSAGGTQDYFISESELEFFNKIVINPSRFGTPKRIEDLQINYNRIDTEDLIINFE
jgi:hypothetical protein